MIDTQSPAIARRRLRRALRTLRESTHLTQGDVAKRLDWSLSKVNRIELGEVSVSSTDLQALLRLFRIDDDAQIERLTSYCRAARKRDQRWSDPQIRAHLTPATIELYQLIPDASEIRVFQSALFPGILQTEEFAEWILDSLGHELDSQTREVRLQARMQAREAIFGSQSRPRRCVVVLDESIIYRLVGSPALMIQQFKELLRYSSQYGVEIRILPFAGAGFVVTESPFMILEFDDGDVLLYQETSTTDEVTDNPDVLARHGRLFAKMEQTGLSGHASISLIEARLAALISDIARS